MQVDGTIVIYPIGITLPKYFSTPEIKVGVSDEKK